MMGFIAIKISLLMQLSDIQIFHPRDWWPSYPCARSWGMLVEALLNYKSLKISNLSFGSETAYTKLKGRRLKPIVKFLTFKDFSFRIYL